VSRTRYRRAVGLMSSAIVLWGAGGTAARATGAGPSPAAPPAGPAAPQPPAAAPTAEHRQFVAAQLARLKDDAFIDAEPVQPKAVLDALLAKGPALLPALRDARPRSAGRAREVCDRAILLLTWGFDPDEAVAKAVAKLFGGRAPPAGVAPARIADAAVARALPAVWAYQLSFGEDPATGRAAATPPDPLKTNNVLLLARDGSVATLSTPKAVEAYFKAARKPPTPPAAPAVAGPAVVPALVAPAPAVPVPPVPEQAIQDLFTAWLTLSALTASDAKTTFRPAAETFTFRKNGTRWVAAGRAVPDGTEADKVGQRQLMLVLGLDGSVLTATETTGLKPLRK
jgi:hypothetical protein